MKYHSLSPLTPFTFRFTADIPQGHTHILAKVASKTGPLGSDTARHARTRNRDDAENSQFSLRERGFRASGSSGANLLQFKGVCGVFALGGVVTYTHTDTVEQHSLDQLAGNEASS